MLAGLLVLVIAPWAAAQLIFEAGYEALVVTVNVPPTPIVISASDPNPPTFFFTTDARGAVTFSCAIYPDPLLPGCTSPWTPPGPIGEGPQIFYVRAEEAAGNRSPITRHDFLVDTIPPEVTITGPDGATKDGTTTVDSTPTFEYMIIGDPVTIECKVDLEAYAPCPLPLGTFTTAPLTIGEHTVYVKATDLAGNVGTETRTFLVDAPDIIFLPSNDSVGEDLQVSLEVILEVAPTAPLSVELFVNDPSLVLISSDPFLAGVGGLTLHFPASSTSQTAHLQGLSSGMTYLTAQASAYNDGNMDATIDPSGFVIISPGSIETSAGAENIDMTICAARLNPATLYYQELQNIRGGLTPGVSVVSSDPGVGVVSPSPVFIAPNQDCAVTQFEPVGPGKTSIVLTQPAGFDTPSSLQSIPVQVTP